MILAAYAVIPKTAKQAAKDREGDRRTRGVDIDRIQFCRKYKLSLINRFSPQNVGKVLTAIG